jgi:hypothetical protein
MKTLDPNFKELKLDSQMLCNNDFKKKFRIACFDWDRLSDDELIGYIEMSLEKLITNGKGYRYDVVNPEKKAKSSKYQNSGVLIIDDFKIVKNPSFLDYLIGGHQLSLMLSIDFTGSNGKVDQPGSLHYLNPNQFNDYQKAIISVGNILNYYDSDKMYPVFGFGAKVNGQLSHCFPCNFNPSNPEVFGVQGMLDIYTHAVKNVELYGPTMFSPFLKEANRIASNNPNSYFVCLIITDGEVNDMDQTIEQIIKSSTLPMSIIIVGVGEADFTKMDFLDSDDKLLSLGSLKAERDIVQFVPFSKLKNSNPDALAEEVLREIPKQFMSYMKKKGILPNPRPTMNQF